MTTKKSYLVRAVENHRNKNIFEKKLIHDIHCSEMTHPTKQLFWRDFGINYLSAIVSFISVVIQVLIVK